LRGLCLPASFHPQGLVTLAVVCSLRGLAGFVSRRQRSWEVPFGAFSSREVPGRFRPSELTYRFSQRFLRRPKAPARPDGSRFLSFDPPGNPLRSGTFLAYRPPDAPLGFALLGYARGNLPPDFAGDPLTCLADTARKPPPAPQSVNRSPPGSTRKRHKTDHGQNNPCRVSRQVPPEHSILRNLRAMCSPYATLGIAVMSLAFFEGSSIYRSCSGFA
jgi:hypothetical protein